MVKMNLLLSIMILTGLIISSLSHSAKVVAVPLPTRDLAPTITEFKRDCNGEVSAELKLTGQGDTLSLYCVDYK